MKNKLPVIYGFHLESDAEALFLYGIDLGGDADHILKEWLFGGLQG